ncbi:hypothetical protein BGZ61DRAFT_533722 [Ilyonectria robusta]|uniref:uncharacterized protein n=1 Tax=Ilyonectria robusta TaxID=1079257 RepID=UPI001E8EDE67|nr:uncharacterized protein BGZ61DRAFT_533722 [Ilyonectria robusta]KAH8687085.1 hypothetical protein BGZ61DRAFT_533722 [Ilyonectria robusta]
MEAKDWTSSLLLTQSGKRPISCISAVSSPPSPTKRACYDLDCQKPDAPEILQPVPRHARSSTASLLEALVTSVVPDLSFNEHLQPDVRAHVASWLDAVLPCPESHRQRRPESCRNIQPPLSSPPLSKTAPPTMGSRRGSSLARPSTPSSYRPPTNPPTNPPTPSQTGTSTPYTRLVENPHYRVHLAVNKIEVRPPRDKLPEPISELCNLIQTARMSPRPPMTDHALQTLEAFGDMSSEPHLEKFFQNKIASDLFMEDEKRWVERQPMDRRLVPSFSSKMKVSTPIPDTLYGYRVPDDFSLPQLEQLCERKKPEDILVANSAGSVFPFLAVEFKGDGPVGGAERLNSMIEQFQRQDVPHIDSTAFGIAMNGMIAKLFVSWKNGDGLILAQKIKEFVLERPEEFIALRNCVRSIVEWGMGERFTNVKRALDIFSEEETRDAGGPKTRPPPDGSSAPSTKRPRMSDA